ncbi:MAG: UvrD-helicase domain-containing protein, partial [Bdellovibrionales bacterium]|nr:UvrD-helicase domain-containing protein [Bdellovibrionales bacterium]
MNEPELFSDELNGPQLEAVHTLDGPLLILAGAGSGKTRVLTYRLANLIIQGRATPSQILAVTFTNKAARNMETRSLDLLARFQIPVWERLWISTFHSICVRILRGHVHHLGFQPFFAIFDQSDQLSVINKVIESLNLNPKIHAPKSFQAFINDAKQKGLTPEHIGRGGLAYREDTALDVYTRYEEEMEKNNALDFGDLLLKVDLLFSSFPAVLDEYRERFKYIHVDEYQDTNPIQYKIVQKLAATHQNLCVVGDEDQSIYSWRGADITNILNFEEDFPGAKVIKLEENYRSSQTIVKAASKVISNNSQRKDKSLFTSNDPGDKIMVREENNEYDEARFVAKRIQDIRRETGAAYKDFAVFYRTNAQSRVIEEQLRSNTIAYKIVGGVKFYERLEIKDLMAYLRLMVNPKDDIAVARIINVPTRGIGKTTLEKLEGYAMRDKISVMEALPRTLQTDLFNSSTQKKLNAFMIMMSELRKEADRMTRPSEIY